MRDSEVTQTPTTIVIFGVTGDLSRRKLIPALLHLHANKLLPPYFNIIGFSRRGMTNGSFKDFLKESIISTKHGHSEKSVDDFLEISNYCKGDFSQVKDYEHLSKTLTGIDEKFNECGNKLFYLAVPPSSYNIIFNNLSHSGLTIPCGGEKGWTRVLVEKPFGKDLETAKELDKHLGKLFKEEQIFRIDHYLAKETIQDILSFRFSNTIFEPIWNKSYIEKVEIKLHEKLGMEGRGAFYSDIGALRDVGQNHVLQMLAFIAMENPYKLDADTIRKERAKLLNSIKPLSKDEIKRNVIKGQYEGFKDEPGVPPDSETETYFNLHAFVDNKRWNRVPFYLESGKRMSEKKTEITIYFKNPISCICPAEEALHNHQNILTFRIQPDEGISIRFWAKKTGFDMTLEPKNLSFTYNNLKNNSEEIPNAYEKILFDCIKGDQTLFASTKEVKASWKFITPILENWKKLPLEIYKQGSRSEDVVSQK
jgi:glucose-6-phosphate 1-dehydrogenase